MVELRRILKHAPVGSDAPAGVTSIYVTHDQQEAFAIADRVVVMNAGRIEQTGPPLEVYRQPANSFVARFLGMHNLLPGQVVAGSPDLLVATPLGKLRCGRCPADVDLGDRVVVLVRPDAASLAPSTAGEAENRVHGQLLGVSFRGSQVKVTLGYAADARLIFELPGSAADDLPRSGQPLQVVLDPDGLSLLVAD